MAGSIYGNKPPVPLELPSNSHRYKAEEAAKQKTPVAPVVKSKTIKTKRSMATKFKEAFVADDVGDVKDYVVNEVVVPTIKEMLIDVALGTLESIFWGSPTGTIRNRVKKNGSTPYSSIYDNGKKKRANVNRRAAHDFEEILFDTKEDAEVVLTTLLERIAEYDQVSVAEFYILSGVTPAPVDEKWGWTDLSSATSRRIPNGYVLKLPRVEELTL